MKTKKFLSLTLALVMALALVPTAALAGGIGSLADGARFDFTGEDNPHEELYATIPSAGWYGLTVSPASVEVEVKTSTGGGDSWGEPCPGGWIGSTYYVYLTGVFEEDESSYYYIAIDGEQVNTIDVTYYGETLPDGVPDFRDFTFQGSVLSAYNGPGGDVVIPDRVTTIGERAFNSCDGLISVTIPDCVTTIDWDAFAFCYDLTSVTIPNSVTTIRGYAFHCCPHLTNVTIPNSVTTIGAEAFAYCDGLTSVTIPDSVTTIGAGAFSSCDGLTSILVSINNEQYIAQDGVLFNKNKTELLCYPGGKVGAYIIPDSVTTIGAEAFAGCDSLTNVTIPGSVTTIGAEAFSFCDGLTNVTIPDSVTTIGAEAFSFCDGLTNVTIPDSVTTIGAGAFAHCDGLTSILVSINNEQYIAQDGVLFNKNKTELLCCPGGKVGAYIIPDSVTTIGAEAFAGCFGLTSITIPSSVTTIYRLAFYGCHGLTDVYYGGSEAKWNQITIEVEGGNDALENATIHYANVSTPTKPNNPGGDSGSGGGSTTPSQPENPPVEPENPPVEPETPVEPEAPVVPASEKFSDVEKDSWYESGVTFVTDKGLFQGVSKGVFAPQNNMTRAMLMTVLARLDGQDTAGGETWYSKGMDWAKAQGISDGTQPNANVTREQMVTMLYRYAGNPEGSAALDGFMDGESVSSWARAAVEWAVSQGILNGKSGGRLDPQGTATRAEVATIIQRFVEKQG